MPGGYGVTVSAQIRPIASLTGTHSCSAKNASRGDIPGSTSAVNAIEARGGRGVPRRRSIDAGRNSSSRSIHASATPTCSSGTISDRSAISNRTPAA